MPSPSLSSRTLRALRPSRALAFLAVPVIFVAAPASADECATDTDCGFGFACETIVTSSISGTGGIGGTTAAGGSGAGSAGMTGSGALPQGGSVGFGGTGTAAAAGTSSNGGSGTAGGAGTGTAGTGGTGTAPPVVCGNLFCQAPAESPSTCPQDCVFTTVCMTATCTSDAECASGYVCPAPGSVGTGGGPNTAFCGDILCSGIEDVTTCPVDCDPNYRRCTPGDRGCASNTDCGPGYVCVFTGGTGGASGSAGAFPAGGGSAFTGGTGGVAGGSAGTGAATGGFGTGGSAGVGVGGTGTGGGAGTGVGGIPAYGMCIPSGTGGTYGGTGGDIYGGTAGTAQGGSGALGASGGTGGTNRGDDEDDEKRIITDRGCSLASGSAGSPFAALLVAAVALVRFGRRRARR